jgi:hypothetical protein
MKKTVSALVLMLVFAMGARAQQHSFKNLVGRWESADGAGIEVLDSARIFLLYNGDKKQISSYETNFSRTPCWFDFTVRDSAENINMKSLLLFVNDELLQWQIFEGERPSNFSVDKGTMVYLKRKK